MNSTYEWLYDNYAAALIHEIETDQEKTVKQLTAVLSLSPSGAVTLSDTMSAMRFRWETEIFALGLQLGARLLPDCNSILKSARIVP